MKKKRNILVAVPTRSAHASEISLALTNFLLNFNKPDGYTVDVTLSYKQPVDANRNKIVKKFLNDEANEWLLMCDADIIPPKEILDMIKHGEKIISATVMGMKRGIPHPIIMKERRERLYAMVNLGEYINEIKENGLIEVDGIGTGCVLINREVFENMEPPWFKFEYDKWGDVSCGEDYSFSKKAKNIGYKIYVDTNQICEHYKTVGLKALNHTIAKAAQGHIQLGSIVGKK